nr:hypothetical protein [Methanobrevibacter arboriphilus]
MFNEQFTKEKSINYAESKKWEKLSLQQRARIGMHHKKLCIPFNKLHEAVEKTMNRPVYTHEFATDFNEALFDGIFGNMTRYDLF